LENVGHLPCCVLGGLGQGEGFKVWGWEGGQASSTLRVRRQRVRSVGQVLQWDHCLWRCPWPCGACVCSPTGAGPGTASAQCGSSEDHLVPAGNPGACAWGDIGGWRGGYGSSCGWGRLSHDVRQSPKPQKRPPRTKSSHAHALPPCPAQARSWPTAWRAWQTTWPASSSTATSPTCQASWSR